MIAVIRRLEGTAESGHERLVRKHLPAWVASGAIHLIFAVVLMAIFGGRIADARQSAVVIDTTSTKEPEEPEANLVPEDRGLEGNIDPAVDVARLAEKVVDEIVSKDDPVGSIERSENDSSLKPIGMPAELMGSGSPGKLGDTSQGSGALACCRSFSDLDGRNAATRQLLIRVEGGSEASELAVGRGLAWLARQQKPNGSWVFDGTSSADTIASTGIALLPFLAAGETHRAGKKYQQTVLRGLQYLISQQRSDGGFNGSAVTMYSHAIATIALNEAYGMTKDRNLLLRHAQAATTFIVTKQATDGSWGYSPGTSGDTSIVGWQIQALKAAILTKDIVVPDKAVADAVKFLDKVSSGSRKAVYGYAGPNGAPGTALTAVGLLSRYYFSKWGPGNAGLAEGVDGLMKRSPVKASTSPDMYFYYYATQVVHFAGGDDWRTWNAGPLNNGVRQGGMRDWLISLQNTKEGPNNGSWAGDGAIIGGSCGRLGTTALSLLTLEVYYRHLPLYKRDNAGGLRVLDGVK